MPLIRKIIQVGKTSKAVILPKSWLQNIEDQSGESVKKLALEVDGCITVRPVLPKK